MNHHHNVLPGDGLESEKMPGHWLLARMGKRVLRPGGLQLTRQMIDVLDIAPSDAVIEFAPGLGITAQTTLARQPASYTAVEADEAAAQHVRRYLSGDTQRCVVGRAEATDLPTRSATVVYGEAMLTMQTPAMKRQIVEEAKRLLRESGRYGVHELCLVPDDLDEEMKAVIQKTISDSIHVGARPLTLSEWCQLLEDVGFVIRAQITAPMHLLEPRRLIQDEGLVGAARFAWRVLRDTKARRRVLGMKRVFRRYQKNLAAAVIVAVKR